MALKPIIAPSILAADFGNLKQECVNVLSAEGGAAEWLHWDIMDGHFVPNIALGPPLVESLRPQLPGAFFDVHLMVSEPAVWIPVFAKAGANLCTFHIEATTQPLECIELCRKHNVQCGVALKPGTPAEAVFELADKNLVDMILVMTVEPGFGGQKFMADMMPKVSTLRTRYPHLKIEVDGGLGESNIETAAAAGANVIVAGTSVFRAKDRQAAVNKMRDAVQRRINTRPSSL